MANLASPLEIAAVLSAVGWPFAAGLGVVLWSKVRAERRARRLAALDAELKGFFQTVEGRPVPERLQLVVEALEEAQAMRAGRGAREPKAPAPAA